MEKVKNNQISGLISLKGLQYCVFVSIATQPFDVIRTNSIIFKQRSSLRKTFNLIKQIKSNQGIQGFYRGSLFSISKTIFGYGSFFTVLEILNFYMKNNYSTYQSQYQNQINFVNASIAKIFSTFLALPVNVLKTRVEAQQILKQKSDFYLFNELKIIKNIFKQEGINGFYRGFFTTLLRDVPYAGIQYTFFKQLLKCDHQLIQKDKIEIVQNNNFVIGGLSSILAITICYPFDNLRIRQQNSTSSIKLKIFEIIHKVYKNEGYMGFYKGFTPRLLKKACVGAILWGLYGNLSQNEQIKQLKF